MTVSIAWVRDAEPGESAHTEIVTRRRRYREFRCFPENDWISNVILGGARPDVAVHVGGIATLMHERVFALRCLGIPLVTARSKSALFDQLDGLDEPVRDTNAPVFLPVETVLSVRGRGNAASGRIERGRLRVRDEVELVGEELPISTSISQIELERCRTEEAGAGDHVFALLRGIELDQIARGHVIATPGTVERSSTLRGTITCAPGAVVAPGSRFHVGIHCVRVTGRVTAREDDRIIVELFSAAPLLDGIPFVLFDGPKVAAIGTTRS